MRRLIAGLVFLAAFSTSGVMQAPQGTAVTVFEGARLIVGDGSAPIENAAFIVDNNRFTQVGRRGQVNVPAGATRVDLTGKTVMPAIVDAHTHMPVDARGARRPVAAEGVLRRRRGHEPWPGYGRCGVPGAGRNHPQRRAAPHRGTRDHDAGARPDGGPVLGDQRSGSPEGRAGAGRQESRSRSRSGSTTGTACTRS